MVLILSMFHLMVTVDFQLLKYSLSMLVQSATAATINDFRCSISDYINDNVDELATCTAAADWRVGDDFIDKISILQQYQRTIYNPKKNCIDGCSRPNWFMDQWLTSLSKKKCDFWHSGSTARSV
jgi:hypothetical protein